VLGPRHQFPVGSPAFALFLGWGDDGTATKSVAFWAQILRDIFLIESRSRCGQAFWPHPVHRNRAVKHHRRNVATETAYHNLPRDEPTRNTTTL